MVTLSNRMMKTQPKYKNSVINYNHRKTMRESLRVRYTVVLFIFLNIRGEIYVENGTPTIIEKNEKK